jgi:predicted NUDIX family NTP pyrophosphohydrolase
MPKISAGLLMYRVREGEVEFFLVHPGGPFWKNKDLGAWSIPKGVVEKDEEEFEAAKREFEEETGLAPEGKFRPLTPVRQKGGKIVKAWAFEGDCDPAAIKSKTYKMKLPWAEKEQEFPEIDKAGFFTLGEARIKINPAQVAFLEEVLDSLR